MTEPKRSDWCAFVLLWAYPAQLAIDHVFLNTPDHSIGNYVAIALMFGLGAAWGWSYATKNSARP